MNNLENIGISLQSGNSKEIRKYINLAIEEGMTTKAILEYMLDIMEEVGKKFKVNQLFVPEVLIIGRAFNVALDIMGPMEIEQELYSGTVIIGTVKGDLHDIGKNLVKLLMGSTGTKVVDLGVDVPPQAFVDAIITYKPDIIALSALLTTTMIQINQTLKAIEKAGLRDRVKVIIGGAPVTKDYASHVGADFFANDAGAAAEIVKEYLSKKYHKDK